MGSVSIFDVSYCRYLLQYVLKILNIIQHKFCIISLCSILELANNFTDVTLEIDDTEGDDVRLSGSRHGGDHRTEPTLLDVTLVSEDTY